MRLHINIDDSVGQEAYARILLNMTLNGKKMNMIDRALL
jgi:hypothetical protein